MAFTLSVINSKGGVGKTTTSVALAHLFAAEVEGSTVLLDLDRQGSARAWAAVSAEQGRPLAAEVVALPPSAPPARLARLIRDAAGDADWMVIDTAPGDMDRMDAAIEASAQGGLVVIPTGDGPLDLPRAVVTLDGVEGRAPTMVLLTQTRAGTITARDAADALAQADAVVLRSRVPLRESVKTASTDSRGFADLLELYRPVAAELFEIVAR